ncbi:YecH family protein [Orbaceae bacterium ESL0721]|nr:YecH family protein [Orbaceae bacterium ESL0721]
MESIHGHEVLHMMEGNHYSETSLLNEISQKFGENARFHTCSKSEMSAKELVQFLKSKGKFITINSDTFTVNSRKICHHH